MTASGPRRHRSLSLRARILLLVLGVGLAPLAILGLWISGRTARTGEAVLRERLHDALVEDRSNLEQEWVVYRSRLLDLAELPDVASALADGRLPAEVPPTLARAFQAMDISLESVRIRGKEGEWLLDRGARSPSAFGLPLHVRLPVYDHFSGDSLGHLVAAVNIHAVRTRTAAPVAGAVLTAVDPATGAVLLPVSIEPTLLSDRSFTWDGRPWVAERVAGAAPPVQLIAAAPLDPFASPFRDAGRRSLLVLSAVVALGLALALLLSRRLTASLQQLADAAAAVAAGDLARTVPVHGRDEIGRVGAAFNTMTDNLRRTLAQLSERESLAAVNEFAAALAHEVRNPLTAIQLDLQQVEEQLPAPSPLRDLQAQALADLRKLDRTVAGALETARSGRIQPHRIDLRDVIRSAARSAQPAFDDAGAILDLADEQSATPVAGDPDALERVVLNLLLNGVEAAGAGGRVRVELAVHDHSATVLVTDTGPGVPAEQAHRVFEPFYTTRAGGTGIGLAVARRIVTAHGGAIEVVSGGAEGGAFRVTLPRP